jgi:hypothetical protein
MSAAVQHNAAVGGVPRSTSILSPIVDFLCVGGLSILVLVPLMLGGVDLSVGGIVGLGAGVLWAQILVNYAHFMASYRIVYRDRAMILKHSWATIWVPLIMFLCLVGALVEAQSGSKLGLTAFFAVASGYLAWHYTGQTWGMMVAFTHLNGSRFDRTEYWLIRGGLRILLCWHLAWFLHLTLQQPERVALVYEIATWATYLAALMGVAGLVRMKMRTGQAPAFLVLVAWSSIFVWYVAIARWGLAGLFLVQFAHALQYLEFPTRIEINRARRAAAGSNPITHMAVYGGVMLGVSLLVTLFVPGPAQAVAAGVFGAGPDSIAPVLISYFIGIHHFFTDGVIWKLRNPDVQEDLFAHARPVAATVPVPPLWWERTFWTRR